MRWPGARVPARVQDELMPVLIHKDRLADKAFTGMIRQMAVDTGAEAFDPPARGPDGPPRQPPAAAEHPLPDARASSAARTR